ncbi:inhibitor of nuclear factor kappa-B kinase subunit alpha-like [Ascaphus truei]|uniref:inhibitor of nuclear factor kappa-B kinase subunit alpha-like n=1 Tax=Ascaphus truei TaxID=8439 RepID=UPI003F59096F
MERPPVQHGAVCGPWDMKERLGTGGFGNVCLYHNRETGDLKAIKSCRLELSVKNKERWCQEIQIMKRLHHPNVVKACEVPPEMDFLVNDVPHLAMEYCAGGDLRKVSHMTLSSKLRLSLLRYNTNLTKMKNTMVSASQQLQAKLEFFQQSIQIDLDRYSDQMAYGISSEKMLRAWKEMEDKAASCAQAGKVGYLDEHIMALHTEIVELQRSPYARRQGDVMEHMERRAIELYKQLKPRSPDNAYSDSTEMVRIIVQTVQGQDRVLKELFGHLSKLLGCKQKIIDLLPRIEMALNHIKEADCSLMLMQAKRQREIWHLLKIACTQSSARSLGSASLETPIIPRTPAWPDQSSPQTLSSMLMPKEKDREAFSRMIEENQTYLSQFHTLLQEAKQEQQSGVTSLDWSWMNQ